MKSLFWLYNSNFIHLNWIIPSLPYSENLVFISSVHLTRPVCFLCLCSCIGASHSISEFSRTKNQNIVGNYTNPVWILLSCLPYRTKASRCRRRTAKPVILTALVQTHTGQRAGNSWVQAVTDLLLIGGGGARSPRRSHSKDSGKQHLIKAENQQEQ